jgi:DNA-binding NarL/FixJ family response regulator
MLLTDIAEHTVKNHMKSILCKLDVDDRTGGTITVFRRAYIELSTDSPAV